MFYFFFIIKMVVIGRMSRAERKKRVQCLKCKRKIQKGSIKRHLLTAYHAKHSVPINKVDQVVPV